MAAIFIYIVRKHEYSAYIEHSERPIGWEFWRQCLTDVTGFWCNGGSVQRETDKVVLGEVNGSGLCVCGVGCGDTRVDLKI